MVAAIHKGMGPDKKIDCIACHKTAGHDYSGEVAKVDEKPAN